MILLEFVENVIKVLCFISGYYLLKGMSGYTKEGDMTKFILAIGTLVLLLIVRIKY